MLQLFQLDAHIGDENEREHAGTAIIEDPGVGLQRLARIHQSLRQPAGIANAEHPRKHIQRRIIFVNQRRNLVGHQQRRQVDEGVFNGDEFRFGLIDRQKLRQRRRIVSARNGTQRARRPKSRVASNSMSPATTSAALFGT